MCATGMNFNPGSGGPSELLIDQMIGACNSGSLDPATTSGGWVDQTGTMLGALAVALRVDLGRRCEIGGLKVWNYNAGVEDSFCGAKRMHVAVDGAPIVDATWPLS